jgi:hypothetical protein
MAVDQLRRNPIKSHLLDAIERGEVYRGGWGR